MDPHELPCTNCRELTKDVLEVRIARAFQAQHKFCDGSTLSSFVDARAIPSSFEQPPGQLPQISERQQTGNRREDTGNANCTLTYPLTQHI
jgi:hypothetical protein